MYELSHIDHVIVQLSINFGKVIYIYKYQPFADISSAEFAQLDTPWIIVVEIKVSWGRDHLTGISIWALVGSLETSRVGWYVEEDHLLASGGGIRQRSCSNNWTVVHSSEAEDQHTALTTGMAPDIWHCLIISQLAARARWAHLRWFVLC